MHWQGANRQATVFLDLSHTKATVARLTYLMTDNLPYLRIGGDCIAIKSDLRAMSGVSIVCSVLARHSEHVLAQKNTDPKSSPIGMTNSFFKTYNKSSVDLYT